MRVAKRKSIWAIVLVVVLAGLAAGVVALLVSRPDEAVSAEVETFDLRDGDGDVVTDGSARAGEALRFWGDDRALRWVDLPRATLLRVRARAVPCEGDPGLTVTIDREDALDVTVRSTDWEVYTAPISVSEGRHRVAVLSEPGASNDSCRRALLVDWVSFETGGTGGGGTTGNDSEEGNGSADRPERSRLLFAARFANGLSEFPNQIHPERISVVDDPVLGAARKVLRFRVFNSDTGPTENPRAQIETPSSFDEGDDRYMGFAYYFPEDFPAELPSRAWVTLGSITYGPPYEGAGPVSIRVQNDVEGDGAELRWQRNETYDFDIPWVGPKIADIKGRWVDFVIRTKLDGDPDVGFVELWMNMGSGWEQQELDGQDRLYMETYDSSNDEGPNNSRLGLYYRRDIPGPLTVYHGAARIASAGEGAFEFVAPDSYR